MKPDRNQRADKISDSSMELTPEERASYIEQACDGDTELESLVKERNAQQERARAYFSDLAERLGIGGMRTPKFSVFVGQSFGKYRIEKLIG